MTIKPLANIHAESEAAPFSVYPNSAHHKNNVPKRIDKMPLVCSRSFTIYENFSNINPKWHFHLYVRLGPAPAVRRTHIVAETPQPPMEKRRAPLANSYSVRWVGRFVFLFLLSRRQPIIDGPRCFMCDSRMRKIPPLLVLLCIYIYMYCFYKYVKLRLYSYAAKGS